MNQLDFFRAVSEHLSNNPFGPFFVIMVFFIFLLVIILISMAIFRAKREKMDGEILEFLIKRHRLKDFELKALIKIGRNSGIFPEYLIIMDQNIFKKHKEKLRKELISTINFENQVDEIMEDLYQKPFK